MIITRSSRNSNPACQVAPLEARYPPLLANIYLYLFERAFFAASGPGTWVGGQIPRYADDSMVQARYRSLKGRSYYRCLKELELIYR